MKNYLIDKTKSKLMNIETNNLTMPQEELIFELTPNCFYPTNNISYNQTKINIRNYSLSQISLDISISKMLTITFLVMIGFILTTINFTLGLILITISAITSIIYPTKTIAFKQLTNKLKDTIIIKYQVIKNHSKLHKKNQPIPQKLILNNYHLQNIKHLEQIIHKEEILGFDHSFDNSLNITDSLAKVRLGKEEKLVHINKTY